MFTPKLNKPRSRYSTHGDYSGGTRTRGSNFTPQKKTYTPSGPKQTFNSSVLQTSRVYEECGQHRLESYGQSLPILVTEALALKDRHVEPSVKISPSGWAWLVCGRRLLVWMYRTGIPGKTPPCHELNLPPSSLPHKAGLVVVLPHTGDANMASCMAASPDGALRYWNNIAHEGSFVEISSELKGEECVSLIPLSSHGFIVATASSSLMLIMPGQNCLRSRVLRPPQGMLKGISRRMSSFIFGSVSSQTVGGQFHSALPGENLDDQFTALYVLSGPFLQKWAVSVETEKLLYQCNVEQFVKDCLGHEVWHQGAAHLPNLRTWLLDMEVTRDGVVILAAGVNPEVSKEIYYCIGVLHTEGQDSPGSFLSFTVLQFTNHHTDEDEDRLLGYRLLLPNPANANAFLYEKKSILCTSVTSSHHRVDKLEFYAGNDRILGAGHYDSSALFFSSARGFVSVRSTTSAIETSINESLMEPGPRMDTSTVATPSKLEELSMSEEATSRLKAAFLHSCRGNVGQAQVLVDELFPPGMPSGGDSGSKLDRLVTQLSREMIDDYPASDPRWAESHHSVGSSVSLILIHQLEDKLKAHEYLVQFLKNVGLWDQLLSMPIRDTVMLTNLLLCEHAEKLVAAKTLRDLHTQHQALVDKAIANVLEKRDAQIPGSGLTPADVFYREVSKIHEILEALVDIEEQSIAGELSPRETVSMISTVNSIIGAMMTDAVQYRRSKIDIFQSTSHVHPKNQEYLPWTASEELEPTCKGARTLLIRQHGLTSLKAIPDAQDGQERGGLFQQLLELTGLILDGHKAQLDTIKLTSDQPTQQYMALVHKYEQERTKLIAPFVRHGQYERASALAEKHQDFHTLVEVCEATDSQDRLHRYMNQYQSVGFADFVFKWYLDEGKRGKLMTSSLSSHPQLGRFLQTGENKFMSWLQDINSNNFLCAHKTLFELGVDEKNSAAKKRTLLSLSKLAALATEDPPDMVHNNMEAITEEQDLLLHQEQLPAEVIENIGYDTENMKVFNSKELIELYVGDLNTHADEHDFLKALDLMSFIRQNDPDYSSLINFIWSKSILRDNWSHISAADHLESCRDTIFYKTVELAHGSGYNLPENLPNADTILSSPQLAHMKDDSHFQFLIKASFEQIHRVLNIS